MVYKNSETDFKNTSNLTLKRQRWTTKCSSSTHWKSLMYHLEKSQNSKLLIGHSKNLGSSIRCHMMNLLIILILSKTYKYKIRNSTHIKLCSNRSFRNSSKVDRICILGPAKHYFSLNNWNKCLKEVTLSGKPISSNLNFGPDSRKNNN